ncbi:ABC transporter C family protein [Cavenderia fasciculata]|uniref:ABC transporter C family protein n=1 Tax=Cavenderia fasciculata TaxID=261658 RepID=F4PQK5_CACFS|nr:ABC transporter C family protein [Cavenderia fasciculata]EGG21172.1 ABC transporter C family protein [Cavenderia fasciculata]|eukprot:XP_004359022.1 ABC transporter C family protein [Cavenderia fasciculata]
MTQQNDVEMANLDSKTTKKKIKKVEKEVPGFGGRPSPEEKANPLSRLTYWWADSFVWFCFRHVLQIHHLPDLATFDRSSTIVKKMEEQWNLELKKPQPSYTKAAVRAFGPYFAISWIFYAIYAASQFVGPELLSRMVIYVTEVRLMDAGVPGVDVDVNMGYYYAVALFGSAMIGSFCLYQSNMISARVGDWMRSAIVCDVYRKSLRLSNDARASTSPGEIVNLMSNDAQRMVEVFLLINNGVFAPFQIIVCIVLMNRAIGWPTFIGLALMLFMAPLNGVAAKKLTEIRRAMIAYTDARVKTTNEILQAIKIIKLYAWEDSFAKRVLEKRGLEIKYLYKFSYVRAGLIFIVAAVPTMVSVLVFSTYYGYNKTLNAAKIFSALAYLNILRLPLGFLPIIIALVVQLQIATGRIGQFLQNPEIVPLLEPTDPTKPVGVYIDNGRFTWGKKDADKTAGGATGAEQAPAKRGGKKKKGKKQQQAAGGEVASTTPQQQMVGVGGPDVDGSTVTGGSFLSDGEKKEFTLSDITLSCTGPTLTMVVGSVGSGKSSLCQAMLGEMNSIDGSVAVRGKIAYVAQQAWIINASLRDNIVFGSEFDEVKYQRVLQACALERDIELFPQGDLVEIGERGVNLSGGQKQRVSIARAVYNDADIYILDDPLSAVDAHVGKHLFYKTITGILKSKTVILAANQLNYLPFADNVIVMNHGYISERGTYQQIMESKQEFSKQLEAYGIDDTVREQNGGSSTPAESEELTVGVDKNAVVVPPVAVSTKQDSSLVIMEEEKSKPKEKAELKNKDGKLISQEERESGSVSLKIYFKYFESGGLLFFAFVFVLFLFDTGTRTVTDWWLSHWSNEQLTGNDSGLSDVQYLYIYIGIGVGSVLISGARNIFYFTYTVKAGLVLHNQLFKALLRAPMWFFDTTPLGRIINRFTRDLDGIDNLLAPALSQYLVFFTTVVATLIIISIITPFLLVPLAPIIIIYYILQYFYRFTSRELQRLESISRSPIFAHFGETLSGVQTIRAYRQQDINIVSNQTKLDTNNNCYLTLQAMNQWLGLRLDVLGNLVIFFAAVFITVDRGSISLSNIGLSLSYALSITGNLNRATLQGADLETKMNSVERLVHYINGPEEAQQVIETCRPEKEWPQHGQITFDNLVMRYREGLDPVLKGISCNILPQEKIGIVGRTGAGKSSIVLALFRLIEASEGRILIDGKDIAQYGLKDLRRNLSIIPQDAVMFSGTLRDNLDPFQESTDEQLWDLLEKTQLKKVVQEIEGGLLSKVTENGDNWSVGQRQLICLGRALLRKPKILVLDEATASVDSNTDYLIQKTVRENFSDCTILTIAHRLNTIMDSDRIMVMNAGLIEEMDTPHNLLQNQSSLLSWLVEETGAQNAALLRKMAATKSLNVDLLNTPSTPQLGRDQQPENTNNNNIVAPPTDNNNIDNNNNNNNIVAPPPSDNNENNNNDNN